MDSLINIAQGYQVFLLVFMLSYMIQHFIFTYSRLYGEQKNYYHDIIDNEVPGVSILVPMHNEELVARNILNRLVQMDYPIEQIEIIPINDHSDDNTKEILDEYAQKYPHITPYHRLDDRQKRGKT